jgi:hypothetical protein
MLPPIAYTPPPQPKKITNRKRRIAGGEVDDTEEIHEAAVDARPAAAGHKPPPANFPAIEGADRKPHNPKGRLSESTLTVMLQVQELK